MVKMRKRWKRQVGTASAIALGLLAASWVAAIEVPTAQQKQEIQQKITEGNAARAEAMEKKKVADAAMKQFEEAAAAATEAREAKEADPALEKAAKEAGMKAIEAVGQAAFAMLKLRKLRDEAIVLTDKYYDLDAKNVKTGEARYDPTHPADGATDKDGNVRIGEDAFEDPAWLASVKFHEFIHADRAAAGDFPTTPKGTNMAECEAYDKELELDKELKKKAKDAGLSKEQIDMLKMARKWYYDTLSAANKKKVDGGDYVAMMTPLREAIGLGLVAVDFVGQGRAAGHVFKLEITRNTPEPFTLEIAVGTPISPGVAGVQTMMVGLDTAVTLVEPVTTVDVVGYCLNPELAPPPTEEQIRAGDERPTWTVVNPWERPEVYQAPAGIISAGNTLAEGGAYHTDMPKQKYLQTVVQRAIWHQSAPQKYNKERLHQDLVAQVERSGGRQTPEQIQNLTDHLWDDIDLTIKEGQRSL